MKTAPFKLEQLHLVPGLAEDFNRQVAALVADCKQRPALKKKRIIKIEIEIEPHANDPEDVWIVPKLSTRRPATQIDPIRGRITKAGQLQFDFAGDEDES
jgi:hypothetical protein